MNECNPWWKLLLDVLSTFLNPSGGVIVLLLAAATEATKQKLLDGIRYLWKIFQVYWKEAKEPQIPEPKDQLGIVLLGCLAVATAFLSLSTPILGMSYIFCPLLNGATYDSKFVMYTVFMVIWTVMCCSYYLRQFIATLRHGNVRPIQWG